MTVHSLVPVEMAIESIWGMLTTQMQYYFWPLLCNVKYACTRILLQIWNFVCSKWRDQVHAYVHLLLAECRHRENVKWYLNPCKPKIWYNLVKVSSKSVQSLKNVWFRLYCKFQCKSRTKVMANWVWLCAHCNERDRMSPKNLKRSIF